MTVTSGFCGVRWMRHDTMLFAFVCHFWEVVGLKRTGEASKTLAGIQLRPAFPAPNALAWTIHLWITREGLRRFTI